MVKEVTVFARLSPVLWSIAIILGTVLLTTTCVDGGKREAKSDSIVGDQGCEYVRGLLALALGADGNQYVLNIREAIQEYNTDPLMSITVTEDDFIRYFEFRRDIILELNRMIPPQELIVFHDEWRTAATELRDQAMIALHLAVSERIPEALKVIERAENEFRNAISQAGTNHPEVRRFTHCIPGFHQP